MCVEGIYRYSRDEGTYAELEVVILRTQVRQNVKGRRDCRNGRFRDRDVTKIHITDVRDVNVMDVIHITDRFRIPFRDAGVRCGP